MWDDVDTSPAPSSSGSAIGDFFDKVVNAAGDRVSQDLARDNARSFTGNATDPKLGVAEGSGKPFAAGMATFFSGSIGGVPAPLVLVAVGIVALALVLHKP